MPAEMLTVEDNSYRLVPAYLCLEQVIWTQHSCGAEWIHGGIAYRLHALCSEIKRSAIALLLTTPDPWTSHGFHPACLSSRYGDCNSAQLQEVKNLQQRTKGLTGETLAPGFP